MERKDFLFELGVEEIPTGYIANIEKFIINKFKTELKNAKLPYKNLHSYTTPKRFAVLIEDLVIQQKDEIIEKQGPAARIAYNEDGSLSKAGAGFLRKAGCSEADSFLKKTDKGEYIAFKKEIIGKAFTQIVTDFLDGLIDSIPSPKSMRWGNNEKMTFARPIRNIVLLLGSDVIEYNYNGIKANNTLIGNRFVDLDNKININNPKDYLAKLEEIKVIGDRKKRVDMIQTQISDLYKDSDKQIIQDKRLLEVVVDLVEYPTAIIGSFAKSYLNLPEKIITSTISQNQKYFSVVNGDGSLANEFCFISNGNPKFSDIIREGNEKVVKARLDDAVFFYQEDTKNPLEENIEKLKHVTFQADLGSMYDKTQRNIAIARFMINELALKNENDILRTVSLAKTDLVTTMLGEKEFTKLQGYMGMKYALLSGEKEEVAKGIYEHYMPRGQRDGLPTTETGAITAIVDKLDTICGIIGVGLIPTGSADPFALRRAANGVVKILDERDWEINIFKLIDVAFIQLADKLKEINNNKDVVYNFFKQRVKWLLEEEKIAYDVIDSIINYDYNNIAEIKNRALAIQNFKGSADFEGLVLGFKRVSNILTAAKKFVASNVDENLFIDTHEKSLYKYFSDNENKILTLLKNQNYQDSMQLLVAARPEIDAFFDNVMVNDKDEQVKNNRFNLLAYIKGIFDKLANLNKIVVSE